MKETKLFGACCTVKDGKASFDLAALGLNETEAAENAEKLLFALCHAACESFRSIQQAERPKHTTLAYNPAFSPSDNTVQHSFTLRFVTPHVVNVCATK